MEESRFNKDNFMELIQKLEETEKQRTGYTYFLPSPTQGKRFMIHGWIGPCEASKMVLDIWTGKKTVNDFDCIQEIENQSVEASQYKRIADDLKATLTH